MTELEKRLEALQKQGCDQVSVNQILDWISEIRLESGMIKIGERPKIGYYYTQPRLMN